MKRHIVRKNHWVCKVCCKEKHKNNFKQYNTKPGFHCCRDCSVNRSEQWCLDCEEKYGRAYCAQKAYDNLWVLADTFTMKSVNKYKRFGNKPPKVRYRFR